MSSLDYGIITIHFLRIGGEWAFVQRFLSVPTAADAKKGTYLFGLLYLVTPVIWMLPSMLYQLIEPGANPEQAYILACQWVLPAGFMGLMMAAVSR